MSTAATLGRQIGVFISEEQRQLLERIAVERQLSLSAVVREAIRTFLATAPEREAVATGR